MGLSDTGHEGTWVWTHSYQVLIIGIIIVISIDCIILILKNNDHNNDFFDHLHTVNFIIRKCLRRFGVQAVQVIKW